MAEHVAEDKADGGRNAEGSSALVANAMLGSEC